MLAEIFRIEDRNHTENDSPSCSIHESIEKSDQQSNNHKHYLVANSIYLTEQDRAHSTTYNCEIQKMFLLKHVHDLAEQE